MDQLSLLERHEIIKPLPLVSSVPDQLRKFVDQQYELIADKAKLKWQEVLTATMSDFEKQKLEIKAAIIAEQQTPIYKEGQLFLSKNKNLEVLVNAQKKEATKYDAVQQLDNEISLLAEEIRILETNILEEHFSFYEKLKLATAKLSEKYEDLSIKANAKFKHDQYRNIIWNSIYKKSHLNKEFAQGFSWKSNSGYKKDLNKKFKSILYGHISLLSGNTTQSLLLDLLARNPYELSYDIIYEGDEYNDMSEGKQAFVILKLVLEFNNRTCPLLIDQPEDDLDNRAIYNELVEYLRKQKLKRQIILVTHNPNIVIGTDSELVIIANQHGKNSKNKDGKKFQYLSGAIEYSHPKNEAEEVILEQQGIREHICEILEGGEAAFKRREERYAIKK